MKLSKSIIDRAVFSNEKSKKCILWDDSLSCFGLRIFPSGLKAFVLFYRINGRQRLMTIGRYGVLTLDQARAKALAALNSVNQGMDPLADRESSRDSATFGELWLDYLENYAKPKKKSWREDVKRFSKWAPHSWYSRKADSITAKDVETLHLKIGAKSKIQANRIMALFSKMYNYARLENPTKGIEKWPEQRRDRWLRPEEVLRLKDAIVTEQSVYVKAALWLYLLTAVRRNELLTAQWNDIDFDQRILNLRQTKSGKPHRVHLSTPAIQILTSIPRQEDNPYILPGYKVGHHLVNIDKPWKRVREKAEVADVRLHDLRRTVASWMAQRGESLQMVGKLLNHSNTRTTEQHYAHLADAGPRLAIERHAEKLTELVGEIEL
jgi:integrase